MRTPPLRDLTFTTVTVDAAGLVTGRPHGVGRFFPEDLGSLDLDMVALPGGTFLMGSPESEVGRQPAEGPQHEVTVLDFFISRYQITQMQYASLLGHNPAQSQVDNNPVECVTWFDARAFCQRLSDLTGRAYRLPTEAEWEYACRAGSTSGFAFGPTLTDQLANTYAEVPYASALPGRHREGPTSVGMYPANAFGLHDMHGNLFEWCEDDLHTDFTGRRRQPAPGSADPASGPITTSCAEPPGSTRPSRHDQRIGSGWSRSTRASLSDFASSTRRPERRHQRMHTHTIVQRSGHRG